MDLASELPTHGTNASDSHSTDEDQCSSPIELEINVTSEGSSVEFNESFFDQIFNGDKSQGTFHSAHTTSTPLSDRITTTKADALCDSALLKSSPAAAELCDQEAKSNPAVTRGTTEEQCSYSSNSYNLPYGSWPSPTDCTSYNTSILHSVESSGYSSCTSAISGFSSTSALDLLNRTSNECQIYRDSEFNNLSSTNMQKPKESFLALVAKAILSSSNNSMVLSEIYQWVLDNYPYFQTAKCAWQSSVRHSLSVNECFVKGKRAKNGRGFVWSIHPICIESFKKGDFDRRTARRIVQQSTQAMSDAIEELQKLTRTVHSSSQLHEHHVQQNPKYQTVQHFHPYSCSSGGNYMPYQHYYINQNNNMNYGSMYTSKPQYDYSGTNQYSMNYTSPTTYGCFY